MGDSTSHNTQSISPQAPMNRVVRTPIADASASLWPDNRQRPGHKRLAALIPLA